MTWLPTVLVELHFLIAGVLVIRILRRRDEPTAMIAWILAVITLPAVGMVLYWVFGSGRLRRKVGRRRRRVAHLLQSLQVQARERTDPHSSAEAQTLPEDLAGVEQLGARLSQMPVTTGNDVRVFTDAEETHAALDEALRTARDHIHLEYYIWQPDETGRYYRQLLIDRARAGVKVRLLLDAVGCWRLREGFVRPLRGAGVQVAFFTPLHQLRVRKLWSLHLRNHRKIAVIDGRIAFMGSQNIGDEYRGRAHDRTPWHDAHLRICGPTSTLLQQVFAEDWYFAARERLDHDVYFPVQEAAGSSRVQILPTGPDQPTSILGQVLFAVVASARESLRIVTPYFVPDAAVRWALMHACYRGVRVRLVLPTRSDSALALWAARSFYSELVAAGVEIVEYDAGVLHAKIITVDDRYALLGSANMDARSFRLNFEVTSLLYDHAVAGALTHVIDAYCDGGRRIMPHDVWSKGALRQLGEGVARLFAPLL